MMRPGNNERALPKQDLKLRVIGRRVARQAPYHQVDLTVAQFARLKRRRITENNVQRHARMMVQELADYLAHQPSRHGLGGADPQLTCGWVCQSLQLANTGSQVIEQG